MNLNQLFIGTDECNDIFIDDVKSTNISGYIHQWHVTDEYNGAGGQGADLTGGHIYSSI
jgi:hypothetical protein